jgi:methionyl-tRNA formyltransferase
MTEPRVLFAGTPEFALASLQALVESGRTPVAVLTQPDRPAGRGKKLSASPVKKYALSKNIPVLQPGTLRDESVLATLRELRPDIMIVAAYGLLLPQSVLDLPTHQCLNVHASVLPRWRGAAPIQAAILAGDAKSGVSLMSMTAGLDCGPVFVHEDIPVGETETAGSLHDRLATLGGEMLTRYLPEILDGSRRAEEQDESLATYAGKIKTTDAELDWRASSEELARKVRAYNPVPGAWFMLGDERIKCWLAETDAASGAQPGTLLSADADGVRIACGDASLRMLELQRPGKGRIAAREFAAQLDLPDRIPN